MKIAIIGKGSSALFTAMVCLNRGHSVDIYFDPEKPNFQIAESTTPIISNLMYDTFGLSIGDMINDGVCSLKMGAKFIKWGKQEEFHHTFHENNISCHFDPEEFNLYVTKLLSNKGVEFYPKPFDEYYEVNDQIIINDRFYDFMISCAGKTSDDGYYDFGFDTVNYGYIYTKNEVSKDSFYTVHRATEHGWQAELPFPNKNITRCGYFFDDTITSKEEVEKLFENTSGKFSKWKPKYYKKLIQNKYEAYNGNKLLFLEPIHALSLHYYVMFADKICDFLEVKSPDALFSINEFYREKLVDIQLSLAWHYRYGSQYRSNFWDSMQKKAEKVLKLFPQYNQDSMNEKYFYNKNLINIGCFDSSDYRRVHQGMTGEKL